MKNKNIKTYFKLQKYEKYSIFSSFFSNIKKYNFTYQNNICNWISYGT